MPKFPNAQSPSRSRLHELLEELGSRFGDPDYDRIDEEIVEAQKILVLKLGLDRSSVWQAKGADEQFVLTHVWQKPGWPVMPLGMAARRNVPWALQQVKSGRGFHFSRISDLPPEADQDREAYAKFGPRSNVTVPLMMDGKVFGALAFARLEKEHHWTEAELAEIRLVGGVFARILGQVRAHEHQAELREQIHRQARLSLVGELAATLVHELSQPLSAIRSELGAIRLDPEHNLPAALDAVEESAIRAGQILSNLRGLLRDEHPVGEAVALGNLLKEVLSLWSPKMRSAGITVSLLLPSELPMVRAVPVEVRMVLANLLANASDALARKTEDRRVEISAKRVGRWVRVCVEDTGPGLPDGPTERIFKPLFTTRKDGTGMGLAICWRIVRKHGGKITAGRRRGGGARFEFSLPVAG